MSETTNRAVLANELHCKGYSCAQAVACAFCDILPYDPEELAPILGCFGGGFRSGEICGTVSGAAVVLALGPKVLGFALLGWSVVRILSTGVQSFLYFQF